MSYVVAGAFSGLLMASVCVALGPIALFMLAKEPSGVYSATLGKFPPMVLTMAVVVLSYPVWSVFGGLMGLAYRLAFTQAPGGGVGSPNLVYTVTVAALTLLIGLPLAVLLRRIALWVSGFALLFVGVFGWLLPYFAR